MKKFYAEEIPTKLKDFDVRKLEGKWYKVRGYNKKYDCYPCQTNTFKYNAETEKMETEVKLRVATLGRGLSVSVLLRRKKSGGYWENVLTEKMDVQKPTDRSTLSLGFTCLPAFLIQHAAI